MININHHDGALVGAKYKAGIEYKYTVSVPDVKVNEFALYIDHDGANEANISAMIKLASEGKAPYCVNVGVSGGELLLPCGNRNMRMNSYDLFDREFGDFLVYELVPHIEKNYNIKISPSADMHCISGGSSGGISAFVTAWFHPNYFHRVYMSSPSFLAMGRGNEVPHLIRKCETKPIKIYMECSENEPSDYFGWSRLVIEDAREAFEFARYDFKYKYLDGEWHCSRYRNETEAYERNEWLWANWQSPVKSRANSPRIEQILPNNSSWERCDSFPSVEKIEDDALLEGYNTVVQSNDGCVFYAANVDDDIVYMLPSNNPLPKNRLTHAVLHTIPHQTKKGAIDMAVAKTDRLFVLTEVGIQCVRSFGLIDAIIDLPTEEPPLKIAVADALYLKTASGIYKRILAEECITDSQEKRKQISYYD